MGRQSLSPRRPCVGCSKMLLGSPDDARVSARVLPRLPGMVGSEPDFVIQVALVW
jgi:hypothetical protein